MPGSYSLPNPSSPNTSDALTSLPIRQNFQSLQGQVNNADGAALQAKTVPEAALADAINPRLARTEAGTSYVASGLVISVPGSGFIVTIPSGIAYVLGVRVVYAGGTITVPASQDTYIDISTTGVITPVSVASNAVTGMTLTANSIRIAKIVSNGTAVTSVVQRPNADPIGNIIAPGGAVSANSIQNPYKFSVYRNAASNTGASVFAVIPFDTKIFDTSNNVSAGVFTVPVTGFYQFNWAGGCAAAGLLAISIFINGVRTTDGSLDHPTTAVDAGSSGSAILSVTAGQTVDIRAYFGGAAQAIFVGSPYSNHFSGFLVSRD